MESVSRSTSSLDSFISSLCLDFYLLFAGGDGDRKVDESEGNENYSGQCNVKRKESKLVIIVY
jgi:hypothetical protein